MLWPLPPLSSTPTVADVGFLSVQRFRAVDHHPQLYRIA